MKILISDAFDPSLPERLAPFGEVFTDKERLAEAEVVLIRSKTRVTREYMDRAPALKLVIRGGVGLDNVDLAYAKERGVAVHNTPAASSVAVAELAMALMVALPNHVVAGHNGMRAGQWLKKQLKRTELYGKTLGLIGCGRIGQEVAQRAAAFGMTVLAYDLVPIDHPAIRQVQLDELVPQADYLSLHTPLTASTRGMVNAALIARMKDGARIINTGRGGCVVEADVRDALVSGKLAGYATDVWISDPPQDSPLIDAPNMLMTPHLGASTGENLLRIGDIIVSIITDFAQA